MMTDKVDRFGEVIDAAQQLDSTPKTYALEATDDQRVGLAEQLIVLAVDKLVGQLTIRRDGGLITVQGTVEAVLERECVATLEPMQEVISETFVETFDLDPPAPQPAEEMEADLDAPEPLADGQLDTGAVLTEQVVLAMSPHPRKEGAEAISDPGAGATISPFADLKKLTGQE